jgi:sialate O-acetylesterase
MNHFTTALRLLLAAGIAPVATAATLSYALLTPTPASAADAAPANMPFLSPLFSSNMVLQRDRPLPIWGWTTPGATVKVMISDQAVTAKAGVDGKWMARLKPLKAGGPFTLMVNGPVQATLSNVLVGDVWICSGQSNMEMGIGNVNNAKQEIADADYSQIRLFTVKKSIAMEPRPGLDVDPSQLMGSWSVCNPQTVGNGGWNGFSAVGYFFGRDLHQKLKVPIGLIHTSWGGTVAEAWTSAEALQTLPDYKPVVTRMLAARSDKSQGEHSMAEKMFAWYMKNDPGTVAKWDGSAFGDTDWQTMNLPAAWEQAGIPKLSDFDGIVWFRREFDLPAGAEGKACKLHLGPIDDMDTTWINGTSVGGLNEYNLDRVYDIPAGVLKPGKNTVAIRVLDTGGAGGVYGKPEQMFVEVPGGENIALPGAWKYKIGVPLAKTTPVPVNVSNNPNVPTVLYNGMIAPLLPYGIKGAIWYQGESNAGKAYQYRSLLPTMIEDWRKRWNEGAFPFYIVQLANFQQSSATPTEDAWAELREAQLMTAQHLPNTGLAVIIDIGEAGDIHPKNKQEVGRRLALAALAKTYGEKIEYSGPEYKSMKVEHNQVRLTFDHVGGGLTTKGDEKLTGFAIAGDDHKFAWADAKIEGNTVVVSSPGVSNPVAVRYAWHINPVCNLYNKAGLPASPFRTDSWPGITVNNK